MDMATTLVNKVTNKKKGKWKSGKDKGKSVQEQTSLEQKHSISGPAVGGEGLYIKLTQHERNIVTHIKFIRTALENGGKKTDLTTIITKLLVQLDCVVTTTHQSLTREVFIKNDSIKPRLDHSEHILYSTVAMLVKWADFSSKQSDGQNEGGMILGCIRDFETALVDIVKMVAESQLMNVGPETLLRIRRNSLDGAFIHSVASPVDIPNINPHLALLKKEEKSRKTSWSVGMTPPSPSRSRFSAMKPVNMARDSMVSVQSESSTSDEEKRRSGSAERQQSPDHVTLDWETNRLRSQTAPVDPISLRGPIPVPIPSIPFSVDRKLAPYTEELPPLPGEDSEPPPPLPKRYEHSTSIPASNELQPPLPPRKGYTLPRMSGSYLNGVGRISPEITSSSVQPAEEEKPPPLPVKQKRKQFSQMNGHTSPVSSPPRREAYDDVPPPLPTKQRRAMAAQRGSPTHTPHTPTTPTHGHVHSPIQISHTRSTSLEQVGGLSLPPVPVRMESIPGLKTALETPPPKPPRTDRPIAVEQVQRHPSAVPQKQDEVASTINAVRKYNEEVMKGMVTPGAKPPLPLKKKTVLRYKELIKGYKFDDSVMQPLFIPGMAEPPPPPLPPKRRTTKRKATVKGQASPGTDSRGAKDREGSPRKADINSELSSSLEDMLLSEETDVDGEVSYLECEEASGYLIFHREDAGYTLRGGPLDALVAYAASTVNAVKHFSEAFLLTYYTFITPEDLITKLLYRLDFFYQQGNLAVWTASTSLLVRLLNNLSQPLVKEAEIKLIDMVHQMLSDGNLKFAQLLRNALVEKLNQLIPDHSKTIPIGRSFASNRKLSILEFSPDDIAKQMTVLDNDHFQKVDVAEMLYWAAEQNEEKSPQLTQFTMHFNNVSQWTKTTLLEKTMDMKARIKLVTHFIAIMKCLRENYQNFNSYLAILSAIESSPISRLDWPEKVIKSLEDPRALIDNRGSFKNYREAFSQAKPPCIPYIGLYLQDLTFIEMQPSYLEDGVSINFTKRWKQFKSVDHIRYAQTKQYAFDPAPDILSLFGNFESHASDEELWLISNEIKPSSRTQRTSVQST